MVRTTGYTGEGVLEPRGMRYARVFGAMALVGAAVASLLPWWLAVPCLWFATALALASAAYARFGPAVLGKRADGEIPPWSPPLNGPCPVYVHCALGRSRSATVIAARKIATGVDGDLDSLEEGLRTDHPPVNLQRLALEAWRRRRIGSA